MSPLLHSFPLITQQGPHFTDENMESQGENHGLGLYLYSDSKISWQIQMYLLQSFPQVISGVFRFTNLLKDE